MNARLTRGKTKGQSLPLIALMIVVLFAMVGLAVDVGNTYAEQRNTVRASNASALSGMNTLINGGNDSTVYSTIVKSLESNGIRVAAPGAQPQSGERVLEANYLDAKGDPVAGCPNVGSCGSATPQGVTYIHVNVGGRVDTYFARVVGQNTLPVNANAWASRGPCATGVYPIVVRDSYLDKTNGFINPTSRYSDDIYVNKTEMRIYLKENATPNGGFSFVKWKQEASAGNEGELENMLTGDGNLDERFNEAPWPPSNSMNLPMPASGYPDRPGQLNAGDWLYGNSGLSNGQTGSTAQLNWHIQNRTVLTLPIFDADNGRDGANGAYHVSWLGAFLLRGYGHEGGPGKGWYLDMVYIGQNKDCAVLVTNAPKATSLGMVGQVLYRPRSHNVPQSRPPVEYDVVLDVSGSMSWTFAGIGTKNGNDVQCTGANAGCVGGATDRYRDQTQRRIYIAKQALNAFIDSMNTDDMMRIVTFSGNQNSANNQSAINNLTKAWPNNGWSNNKSTLKAAVQSAGAQGDAYTTLGLTPSAVGLAAGNQALSSAPTQAPDGQTYKRVVIFMTDGVANVFRDGTYNGAGGSSCGPDIAACHVGYVPNTNPAKPKPITAMGIEADSLKQLATIYVIALADVDETGLKNVASDQNYPFFSKALDGSQLPGILASIRTNVTDGQCVPTGGNTWQNQFAPENASAGFGVAYPTVGYVTLTDQSGNALPNGTSPIVVDQQTGNLAYRFSNMSPGIYQMSAWVGYKGDDNASRKYSLIFNRDTQTDDSSYTFQLAPSTALGQVVTGPSLNMDLNGVVCP